MTDEETRDLACQLSEKLGNMVDIKADNLTEALVWHALWFSFVETMRTASPEAYARYERLAPEQEKELRQAISEVDQEDRKAQN
jgi:uncharacterized membrane protein